MGLNLNKIEWVLLKLCLFLETASPRKSTIHPNIYILGFSNVLTGEQQKEIFQLNIKTIYNKEIHEAF